MRYCPAPQAEKHFTRIQFTTSLPYMTSQPKRSASYPSEKVSGAWTLREKRLTPQQAIIQKPLIVNRTYKIFFTAIVARKHCFVTLSFSQLFLALPFLHQPDSKLQIQVTPYPESLYSIFRGEVLQLQDRLSCDSPLL